MAGERRLRAAKQAGLEQIPSILTKGRPAEIALIENLQREDLKPIEEAQAPAEMVEEYGYTQEQLALVVGKARTTITQILSLNKLPEKVKQECPRADIPKRILIEIARKESFSKSFCNPALSSSERQFKIFSVSARALQEIRQIQLSCKKTQVPPNIE